MAYTKKTFHAYYCNPSTLENLQDCGNVSVYFAGIISTSYVPSNGTDAAIKTALQNFIPDLSAIGGPAMIYTPGGSSYTDYLPRMQSIIPGATLFGHINNTGAAAALKLVAPNGQFAVSILNVAAGYDVFGAGTAASYRLYDTNGNNIGATIQLTAFGNASILIITVIGYEGGNLPLISSGNYRYYNIAKANSTNTNVDTNTYSVPSTYAQAATDWLNNITDSPTITYNLTNCTGSSDNPTTINPGDEEEVVFTADAGFTFQDLAEEYSVSGGYIVGSVTVTQSIMSFTVALSEGSTGIIITVQPANVIYNLTKCHKVSGPVFASPGDTIAFALEADSGYQFITASVSVTGATLVSEQITQTIRYLGNYTMNAGATKVVITADLSNDPYSGIDGEDDDPGESVGLPQYPAVGAISAGIFGLFAPNVQQMSDLADFMWTDFVTPGTPTTDQILQEIVEAIKRTISNPLDYIIGLSLIPSQGLSVGSSQQIRFGFINSTVYMPKLTSQFFTVDCGSVYFPYKCGGTFLDYAPYSKFSLYLPYIGVKQLDANDCVGHTIGVIYHGDCVTGGVTAFVTKDGSVMYQFSGCCSLNLPLSSDSWGQTISAAVNIATAIGAAAATGGAAGVAKAAASGAANVASNPSQLSPQVSRSGAISGGAGAMALQYPYMIRESVRFHSTAGMNTVKGYPSGYFRQLADVKGYTVVTDVHLHDIPGLQDEIAEIETILREGAIL